MSSLLNIQIIGSEIFPSSTCIDLLQCDSVISYFNTFNTFKPNLIEKYEQPAEIIIKNDIVLYLLHWNICPVSSN